MVSPKNMDGSLLREDASSFAKASVDETKAKLPAPLKRACLHKSYGTSLHPGMLCCSSFDGERSVPFGETNTNFLGKKTGLKALW
jgi:hypothetical protein